MNFSKPTFNALYEILEKRFGENENRHKGIKWSDVLSRLESVPEKVAKLLEMENTGGQPDVVGYDEGSASFLFFDCAAESPKARRSLCYDAPALLSRKENKPSGSALGMANLMGIEMLNETQYRYLQTLGDFDTKTSSWLLTPAEIRNSGGAIFGDRRYGHVFIYHNGAESYYAARGFRGCLKL